MSIEQKLAQQLGAQQLEIMKLSAVIEECRAEINRLQALVPKDGPAPVGNGHDTEKPVGAALQ